MTITTSRLWPSHVQFGIKFTCIFNCALASSFIKWGKLWEQAQEETCYEVLNLTLTRAVKCEMFLRPYSLPVPAKAMPLQSKAKAMPPHKKVKTTDDDEQQQPALSTGADDEENEWDKWWAAQCWNTADQSDQYQDNEQCQWYQWQWGQVDRTDMTDQYYQDDESQWKQWNQANDWKTTTAADTGNDAEWDQWGQWGPAGKTDQVQAYQDQDEWGQCIPYWKRTAPWRNADNTSSSSAVQVPVQETSSSAGYDNKWQWNNKNEFQKQEEDSLDPVMCLTCNFNWFEFCKVLQLTTYYCTVSPRHIMSLHPSKIVFMAIMTDSINHCWLYPNCLIA